MPNLSKNLKINITGTAIRSKKFGGNWEFRGLTEFFGLVTYKIGSRSIVKIGKAAFKVTLHGILYSQLQCGTYGKVEICLFSRGKAKTRIFLMKLLTKLWSFCVM